MSLRKFATFFFSFLFTILASAQERIPLREYLDNIESRFPYDFSFRDLDLANHYIVPTTFDDIQQSLSYLKETTLFQFEVLNDRTVAITKKENVNWVCGIVFSSESDTPLSNVTITTKYQRVAADANGNFEIDYIDPNTTIDLQYIGFEELQLNAGMLQKEPCKTIQLLPKIEFLSTVTLSNYFAKGISKNLDGSLSVDYDEFDLLPGLIEPDVLLTIQALPGIQSVNETVSFINIRGGTNDQNLILWDGIKMYQNGHFFGLISAFNPLLTKEVTLYKNGSPSSYGDGVSGVIAMESDSKIDPELRVDAGVNLISADAFANIPLGTRGSVHISGRKSINSVLETPTFNTYFDRAFQNSELTQLNDDLFTTSNDNFSFFDASLRGLYQVTDKDLVRVNFLILANDLEFLENGEFGEEFRSLQSDLVQNNLTGGFYYERNWNDQFQTQLQWYGTNYELQALNADIMNDQALLQENDVLETGVKVSGRLRFSEKIQGTLGYQWNETGITNFERINNPFFQRRDKRVIRTNSAFAETKYLPFANVTLHAGLRVNHIDKFNEVLWEPRVSLNYRFLKHFAFEILGEIKSQTTSKIVDFQDDFLGIENRRWVLSTPGEIPIVKGQQLSAGISMNRKGWLVSAEPYLKKVTGITSQSQGFQNQFREERTSGSYTTSGIDFLINKRFRKINTWLSYSYAENDYNFDTFDPSEFHNNLDIRHRITYGINYAFRDFNISGGFTWHSGRPTTLLVEGAELLDDDLNFAAPNAANLEDYMRVDVSATYRFKLAKGVNAFAGLSIWNLFDKRNVVNRFYGVDMDNIEVLEIDEVALRFTPNASFSINF
ncbi:MAG: TonB-dependent receptor plug domain-containing protein [Bacteroidota bacterium]